MTARTAADAACERELAQACATFNRADYPRALAEFRRLAARYPRVPAVVLAAARAYGQRFEFARARACLDRARAIAGSDAAALHRVGEVLRTIGLASDSLEVFRRAWQKAPSLDTARELAQFLERSHRLDDALEVVGHGLGFASADPVLRTTRARILRRMGETEAALSELQEVERGAHTTIATRARALGDMAELLDAEGRFDEAWTSIERCKSLLRPSAQASLGVWKQVAERMSAFYTDFERLGPSRWLEPPGDGGVSFALLAGFPRSGTTLLDTRLERHPGVRVAEELPVFAERSLPDLVADQGSAKPLLEALLAVSPERLRQVGREFLACLGEWFPQPARHQVLVDKNPGNTLLIPVYARVLPATRFIIALRDPRDVLLSCYLRYLPVNPVSASFLSLESLAERYRLDMSSWLRVADAFADRTCVVRYEELVRAPAEQTARVLGFLGLPAADDSRGHPHPSSQRIVATPSYAAVTGPVSERSVGRWRHYEKHIGPLLDALDTLPERLGYGH